MTVMLAAFELFSFQEKRLDKVTARRGWFHEIAAVSCLTFKMSTAVLWVATFQNIGQEFLSPPNAAGLLIATLTMILCHCTLCQTTLFFFVNLVAINPCGQTVVFQFMINSENLILEKKNKSNTPLTSQLIPEMPLSSTLNLIFWSQAAQWPAQKDLQLYWAVSRCH